MPYDPNTRTAGGVRRRLSAQATGLDPAAVHRAAAALTLARCFAGEHRTETNPETGDEVCRHCGLTLVDLPYVHIGPVWTGSMVTGWAWSCSRTLAPSCGQHVCATEAEARQRAAEHCATHDPTARVVWATRQRRGITCHRLIAGRKGTQLTDCNRLVLWNHNGPKRIGWTGPLSELVDPKRCKLCRWEEAS